MALLDNVWYVDFGDGSTTGYYSVTKWATGASKVCGNLVRQNAAPTVGNERVFVCYNSTGGTGTTSATTEPTWVITRGGLVTDNTVKWGEVTGVAALNGDLTNTLTWAQLKAAVSAAVLGQVIQSNDGTKVLICTVAGAISGSEPSWSAYTTTGATTPDTSATWVTIAAVPSGFSKFAAPHARLENAYAANWGQAGNKFFVASEHAQTKAAATSLASPGTSAAPCHVICVDKTNAPPGSADVTTGATISTTGANSISFSGFTEWTYYDGIGFLSGSGSSAASIVFLSGSPSAAFQRFENCAFTLNNTSVSSFFELCSGVNGRGRLEIINPTFTFGATGQCFSPSSNLGYYPALIRGGSIAASGSIPTDLFSDGPVSPCLFILDGVDLSTINTTLFNNSVELGYCQLRDCKLNASVTIAASGLAIEGCVDLIRCDSGGHTYRTERHNALADETTETTVVRTGGASFNGTGLARKIVSSAKCARDFPYEALPLVINNKATGASKTLTIYGIWGGGAVPTSDQIWIETKYPGSSGSPLSTIVTTAPANLLAAGSNLPSDSSTWGGSTTPFKMSVTFTPQLAGPIETYVRVGSPSQTFYIDEAPTLQ